MPGSGLTVKSFAKINLGLEVRGRRPDGYHEILTLFQTVSFCDILTFRTLSEPGIRLTGDDPGVPWDETNLIHRAARLFNRTTGARTGAAVDVRKHVPAGKGLGGGSANAAVTLWALNELRQTGLDRRALQALGRELGADVPYFLEGGLCLGRGRGDELDPLPDLPETAVLIVLPPFPISTAEIYAHCRPALTSGGEPGRISQFLDNKDFELLENQLEETIFRFHPSLEDVKSFLKKQGAAAAMVTGSGSAVYGLFPEREKAEAVRAALPAGTVSVLAGTLSREAYWTALRAGV